MDMTAVYRITLLDGVSGDAFIQHMREVFAKVDALKLTRTTSGFEHRLLQAAEAPGQFAWLATVHLVNDRKYDFHQWETVQAHVKEFGRLTGIDSYTHAA